MSEQPTYTRAQYLNHECTHREYYAQFVNDSIRAIVKEAIPEIFRSKDEHFNDISLRRWDMLVSFIPYPVAGKLKELGDYMTLAGGVCILKEAARQLVEAAKP